MSDAEVVVRPVSEAPWVDVERVFGSRGPGARCWCQFFKLSREEWRGTSARLCQDALKDQAVTGPGPGLLAYVREEPVGWCAVEPRTNFPRLLTSKVVLEGTREPLDDPSVWVIACLLVRVGFRRRGVALKLASRAVEYAHASGARVIEAYPVDTLERPGASSDELYQGTVTVFRSAGLEVDARPFAGRALMRLPLEN